MTNPIIKRIELSDGRTITLETGKLAKQADGAVELRMGNTMLLATVCAAKDAAPGVDFMPLQVEYKEKFSAFGRFPGGFMKREGRPSDYEILTSRLIDRALRPLFPDDYHAEVFVTVMLFSADGEDMPDALAGLAASAALAVSDIPFNGPLSEVRVARVDGQLFVNPTFSQLEKADMDIMVGATIDNIMMVEGEMSEVSEAELLEAIKFAHEEIKKQCQAQLELMELCGTVNFAERLRNANIHTKRTTKNSANRCGASVIPKRMSLLLRRTATSMRAWMLSRLSSKNSWNPFPKKNGKQKPRSLPSITTTWKKKRCAAASWMRENVWTEGARPIYAPFGVRWIMFKDHTDQQCSPAVKRNRSQRLPWVRN